MNKIAKWLTDTANVLFDDTKNDLRALPKTVRLQLLIVLSGVWSTVFSIWIYTNVFFVTGWVVTFLSHLLVIFAAYYTFKQFHGAEKRYYYHFNSYHSVGRSRGGMIGYDGTRVKWDPTDPGGEHE